MAYPVKDDEGRGKVEAGLPLSSVRLHRQRHGAGHRARVPAARLRAIPAGRRLDEAAAGRLGLCLSVVRHLVEAQGGRVHALSAGAGQGAPFTVELPPPADALYARGRARLDVIIGDMGCLGWTATK